MDAVVSVCVAEYARYSDDPWAKVAVVYIYIYIYIYMCYIHIYIRFDNSDIDIRHGPYLKICIIYFRIIIYFDYTYAFPV